MKLKFKQADQDQALLTVAGIRKLQSELEEDEHLFVELQTRIPEKKRMLEAAMLFAPKGFDTVVRAGKTPSLKKKKQDTNGGNKSVARRRKTGANRITWIGEIRRIMNASPKGLSHKETLVQAKMTALGKRQSAGEKGFYTAIAKLAKNDEIVKHGGLLYSKKLANKLTTNGQMLPEMEADVRRRSGSGGALVVSVLSEHLSGLTASELKKVLAEMPNAPESIRAHGQYIYNLLGTLMGAGTVKRENGVYRLSQPSNVVQH